MDFYGIGSVALATTDARDLRATRAMAFGLSVAGDLEGSFVLLTDHPPIAADRTSALELLNVLAARLSEALAAQGTDLVLGTPLEIDSAALRRLTLSGPRIERSWSGIFSGASPFDFELYLAVRPESREPAAGMPELQIPPGEEDLPCSHHS